MRLLTVRAFPAGLLCIALAACDQSPASPPLDTCADSTIPLPPYPPTGTGAFVRIQGSQFAVGDAPYLVRGVNYYPVHFPWRRFLTQTDLTTVDQEFGLLQSAGLNTLRIFLWNDALFQCPGSGAVPVVDAFARLDGVLQRAAAHGFHLIVTLNDLADLTDHPLYTDPSYVEAQTRFIIERYRDEPAILAWDLRNEGDIDYGSNYVLGIGGQFSKEMVIGWLARTAALVRSLDSHHLITAGWLHDSESTVPYVDFVSFHHWTDSASARERITALQAVTDKPILVEEFGYSTQIFDLDTQSRTIGAVIDAVESAQAAGWLIWTAFDFPTDATCIPPACPSPDNAEHHFGLWYVDYTPKPAAAVIIR